VATILVVDDEPDICELVRMSLERDGHTVLVAHDGEAGLQAVLSTHPDLVVLDVMMPVRDGFSVLERIKTADGDVSATPVIMLTARVEALDRVRGGIEGAVRYLTKPFSVAGLRAAVTEVLAADEPLLRRRAQAGALGELARLEAGRAPVASVGPRPHLTRLEGAVRRTPDHSDPASSLLERVRPVLTARQAELLDAVVDSPDLRAAAERLGVSRSYLYAGLRRIARKAGVATGPALVAALRDDPARSARATGPA
jgi:DNA-binding response OmpR family regulator/DNA-binding CsgD family transcriptional regulator